jgi:hydrogenase maturation protein HypF
VLLDALLADLAGGAPPSRMAGRFHGALAALAEETAKAAGQPRVVLTGGCFQNAVLLDAVADRLEGAGFEVLWHRQVPPNDGGIALGQAVASHAAAPARGTPAD